MNIDEIDQYLKGALEFESSPETRDSEETKARCKTKWSAEVFGNLQLVVI